MSDQSTQSQVRQQVNAFTETESVHTSSQARCVSVNRYDLGKEAADRPSIASSRQRLCHRHHPSVNEVWHG